MATTPNQVEQHPGPTPQQQGESIPDNDSLANDDRGTKPYRMEDEEQETEHEPPGDIREGTSVEASDQVPADGRNTGETGEDEDLPDGEIEH